MQVSNLLLLLFFSRRKQTSMACPSILSNLYLKNSELKTTHNTFRDCRVHFFRQPLSKQLHRTKRSDCHPTLLSLDVFRFYEILPNFAAASFISHFLVFHEKRTSYTCQPAPQAKLISGQVRLQNSAQKSLFQAISCVPGFEYAP